MEVIKISKQEKAHSKSAPEKKEQKQYPIVMSSDCEKCKDKCKAGNKYLNNLKVTGKGKGVVCRK